MREPPHNLLQLALLSFVILLVITAPQAVTASGPLVHKVEPPNWWTDFAPEVMVLVKGENLSASSVETAYAGVKVVRIQSSVNAHYLFMWIEIAKSAGPGEVTFQFNTPSGIASFRWPLMARAPQTGRFQGISPDDAIYLIMPDRFADGDSSNDQPLQSPGTYDRAQGRAYHGGDLRGIRNHLDYLQDLGVTAVLLNPVYDNDNHSAGDYHGYGAVDFYAVDEHLGTLRELQDLVAAAHQRGMKLLLDVVVNHTGPRHPWVKDPPVLGWFHGTPEHHGESKGTFSSLTDPHALSAQYLELIDGWFANILPDLNQENQLVAQYLIENSLWWAEISGLDGFRLDTFPYVPRTFWAEWHKALFDHYPRMTTIGEVFDPDPAITSFFSGGDTRFDGVDSLLPTLFDFPTYFALRDVVIKGAPARKLVDVLQHDSMYRHPQSLVTFFGNHDVTRFFTAADASKEKLENAFSILLTTRGIPQLYYGDEIALTGGYDPDNRRDFPGGFPGDPRNAFTAAGRTADEQVVFVHVQSLLRLRKTHRALREGRQWNIQWDDTSYVFLRDTDSDHVLVIFNNDTRNRHFKVDLANVGLNRVRSAEPLLGGRPATLQNGKFIADVSPHTVSIYSLR